MRWIKTADKLPPPGIEVLVWQGPGYGYMVAELEHIDGALYWFCDCPMRVHDTSHWTVIERPEAE
jgi:hypothetical protein